MDLTVKAKFMPGSDDLARNFGIPFRDLAHQIETGLHISQQFQYAIDRQAGVTTIQILTRLAGCDRIVTADKGKPGFVVDAEQNTRGWGHDP